MHVGEHASRIDFRRDLPGPDLSIFGPAAVAVASIARPEDFFRVAEEHDELGVFRQFLVQLMRFVKPRLEALRRIQVLTTEKRGVEPRDDFVEVLEVHVATRS